MWAMAVKRQALVIGTAAVIVAGLVFAGWYTDWFPVGFTRDKILGQAAGHKVTPAELARFMQGTDGLSQKQAIGTLLDHYFYLALGKKLHVSVSDADVQQQLDSQTAHRTDAPNRNYLLAVDKNTLLAQKINAEIDGYYRGRFVVAHFDQHLVFNGQAVSAAVQQAQQADKAYATKFIGQVQTKLDLLHEDINQGIIMENSDPKIGLSALPAKFHSKSFNTANSADYMIIGSNASMMAQLKKLPVGQHSKPFIYQVQFIRDHTKQSADAAWMIVQLDQVKAPEKQSLEQDKAAMNYKVYI